MGGLPGAQGEPQDVTEEHHTMARSLQAVAGKAFFFFDTFPGRRVGGNQEYLTKFKNICCGYDCFTHLHVINAYKYTYIQIHTYIYVCI